MSKKASTNVTSNFFSYLSGSWAFVNVHLAILALVLPFAFGMVVAVKVISNLNGNETACSYLIIKEIKEIKD